MPLNNHFPKKWLKAGDYNEPPMQIHAERAFWILDYYRRHETCLAFGAKILGEEAACEAKVLHVWRETQSMGISLFAEEEERSWHRLIPLKLASYFYFQIGDPDFQRPANALFHSVLIIGFPDGTTICLAESAS